jgi:hypothetical protein
VRRVIVHLLYIAVMLGKGRIYFRLVYECICSVEERDCVAPVTTPCFHFVVGGGVRLFCAPHYFNCV